MLQVPSRHRSVDKVRFLYVTFACFDAIDASGNLRFAASAFGVSDGERKGTSFVLVGWTVSPYLAAPTVHRLVSEKRQRLVCRSSGPKTVRAVHKVLFIDRFQQHDNRPLEYLVLQGGNSDRASLGTRTTLRNVHAPHRRSVVRAGLRGRAGAGDAASARCAQTQGHMIHRNRARTRCIWASASLSLLDLPQPFRRMSEDVQDVQLAIHHLRHQLVHGALL